MRFSDVHNSFVENRYLFIDVEIGKTFLTVKQFNGFLMRPVLLGDSARLIFSKAGNKKLRDWILQRQSDGDNLDQVTDERQNALLS